MFFNSVFVSQVRWTRGLEMEASFWSLSRTAAGRPSMWSILGLDTHIHTPRGIYTQLQTTNIEHGEDTCIMQKQAEASETYTASIKPRAVCMASKIHVC